MDGRSFRFFNIAYGYRKPAIGASYHFRHFAEHGSSLICCIPTFLSQDHQLQTAVHIGKSFHAAHTFHHKYNKYIKVKVIPLHVKY